MIGQEAGGEEQRGSEILLQTDSSMTWQSS